MDKKLEKFYLLKFKEAYPSFPNGNIDDEVESPDFLIMEESKVLGIEVTELHQDTLVQGAPQRQQESEREIVVNMAKEICENRGLPPLYVVVSFIDVPIRKAERKQLANKIATIVESNIPKNYSFTYIPNESTETAFIAIEEVFISRYSNPIKHNWFFDNAVDFVQESCIAAIQKSIDEKNSKLGDYLKKCDECWLVIIIPGTTSSTNLHPDIKTRGHEYNTMFSRSFVFHLVTGSWFELITKKTN